ncbi:unnamed protein product [Amaranthus hypochondriacus]
MSMKMKGLLKGLRYISTIFDEEEQQEMQIGFPTDVRHVAHIGWDGSAANSPSWINTFKNGDSEEGPANGNQQLVSKSRGRHASTTGLDTPPLDSPSRRRSDKAKGSRRTSSVDSPKKSSLGGQEDDPSSSTGSKLTTRRKKPKSGLSSGQSSSRTSNRSKHSAPSAEIIHFSDPGIGGVHSNTSKPIKSALGADRTAGRKNKAKDTSQSSAMKVSSEQDDQNSLDDISKGIHDLR